MKKKFITIAILFCVFAMGLIALGVSAAPSSGEVGYIRQSSDGHYLQNYRLTNVRHDVYQYTDYVDLGVRGVKKVYSNRDFAVEVTSNTCGSYTTYFAVIPSLENWTEGSCYPTYTDWASVNVTGANTAEYLDYIPSSSEYLWMVSRVSSRMTGNYTNGGIWSPDTY